jgi:hypothetical protein
MQTSYKSYTSYLGIIAVLALWTLGIFQDLRGGSFGLFQTNWLTGSHHWIIQVIHLLLGIYGNWTGRNDRWPLSPHGRISTSASPSVMDG